MFICIGWRTTRERPHSVESLATVVWKSRTAAGQPSLHPDDMIATDSHTHELMPIKARIQALVSVSVRPELFRKRNAMLWDGTHHCPLLSHFAVCRARSCRANRGLIARFDGAVLERPDDPAGISAIEDSGLR